MTVTESPADPTVALPLLVHVDQAFSQRIISQRAADALEKLTGGTPYSELMQTQMNRVTAFRALLRDFPLRDETSLWAHAYDVEIELHTVDPTNSNGQTASPLSAGTTA
jgi:hypothetical protein